MKRIIPLLAVLAMATQSINVFAAPPERQRGFGQQRQRGGEAQVRRGRRPDGQRSGAAGANAMMNMDPAQIAQRMMGQFDKDGDQKLDKSELIAMLTSMRERRGMGPGSGDSAVRDGMQRGKDRPEANGKPGNGDRANRKRRPKNDNDDAQPGGTKPRRPASDSDPAPAAE